MTQNAHHTPGPWDILYEVEDHDPVNVIIRSVSGGLNFGICEVFDGRDGGAANARLIAAARKLYQVAKVIEAAYLNGPTAEFHARVNRLAGGSGFDGPLIDALELVELAA